MKTPLNITQYALSGQEIKQLNPDATLMKYTDLYNYNNIYDAFQGKKKLILLYLLQSPHSGHWTTLFFNKNGLNYFDSYGVQPDYQFELLPHSKRKRLHEEQDYLKKLLHNERVIYNNITYQGPGTATCGCFVTYRLHHSELDDYEFLQMLLKKASVNKTTPDDIVSKWTFRNLLESKQSNP